MSHYKGAASEMGRAERGMKARQKLKEDMDQRKRDLETANAKTTTKIGQKFAADSSQSIEVQLRNKTYGLVTLKEMLQTHKDLEAARDERIAKKMASGYEDEEEKKKKKKKKKKKQERTIMSFDVEEEDDITEAPMKKLKTFKNPEVDTSFLPDRERERKEREERDRLQAEWKQNQEKIKNEVLEITYSYWDGSGHRRSIMKKKGDTVQQFLQGCLLDLRKEFHELRGVTVEGLIYVKEDLIIPHSYSFYDFIVTKARGKSGPLFSFDVHDDVRMVNDATVEKDETHAGKVILRSWYERNKHIFPASRWETYDPEKKWDSYTIADSNKTD